MDGHCFGRWICRRVLVAILAAAAAAAASLAGGCAGLSGRGTWTTGGATVTIDCGPVASVQRTASTVDPR